MQFLQPLDFNITTLIRSELQIMLLHNGRHKPLCAIFIIKTDTESKSPKWVVSHVEHRPSGSSPLPPKTVRVTYNLWARPSQMLALVSSSSLQRGDPWAWIWNRSMAFKVTKINESWWIWQAFFAMSAKTSVTTASSRSSRSTIANFGSRIVTNSSKRCMAPLTSSFLGSASSEYRMSGACSLESSTLSCMLWAVSEKGSWFGKLSRHFSIQVITLGADN